MAVLEYLDSVLAYNGLLQASLGGCDAVYVAPGTCLVEHRAYLLVSGDSAGLSMTSNPVR